MAIPSRPCTPRWIGTALSLMLTAAVSLPLYISPLAAQQTPSVEQLIDNLQATQNETTRGVIAEALGRIGAPAVSPLIEAFRTTQNETTRGVIAEALGRIGAPAAPAVGPLIEALQTTE